MDVSHVRDFAASDAVPGFMSYTHVFQMNRRLAVDEASKAEAEKLDRKYVMAYELTDAPNGKTEWWLMNFDPAQGVYFELKAPSTTPDMTMTGDYKAYMRFIKKMKAGEASAEAQPVTYSGNVKLMEIIGAAFATASKAARVKNDIPDV